MGKIKQFLKSKHDFLSTDEKNLLLSFFLFGCASVFINTYLNTFLWRQTQDVEVLAIFNAAMCAGLALGFWFNALLFRYIGVNRLFAFGCLTFGAVPFCLTLLGGAAADYVGPMGLALGVAGGFYWANRNLLTSIIARSEHRYRFISYETILAGIAGIAAPVLIGYFLIFGAKFGLPSIESSYQVMAAVGLVFLAVAGLLMWHSKIKTTETASRSLRPKIKSTHWNIIRGQNYFSGFIDGNLMIVVLVLTLNFLGDERMVGLTKTCLAILGLVLMYVMSTRISGKRHQAVVAWWLICSLLGYVVVAIYYNASSVWMMLILSGISTPFVWPSISTLFYASLDKLEVHKVSRSVLLLDRELWLNIGRISGLAVTGVVFHFFGDGVLRYSVFIIALPLVALLLIVGQILKHLAAD